MELNAGDVITYGVGTNTLLNQPDTKIHVSTSGDAQVEIKGATRLEVIDCSNGGRVYVNMNVKSLDVSVQDDGKTIKLFVE